MTDPEELISSVLRDYSDVEPGPGWQERILARAVRPRMNRWLILAPAFGLATVAILWVRPPVPITPDKQEIAKIENKAVPIVIPVRHFVTRHPHRAAPKQSVFPTPFPLTNEERALLRIAASENPGNDMSRFIDPGPIQISPIQITALEKEN